MSQFARPDADRLRAFHAAVSGASSSLSVAATVKRADGRRAKARSEIAGGKPPVTNADSSGAFPCRAAAVASTVNAPGQRPQPRCPWVVAMSGAFGSTCACRQPVYRAHADAFRALHAGDAGGQFRRQQPLPVAATASVRMANVRTTGFFQEYASRKLLPDSSLAKPMIGLQVWRAIITLAALFRAPSSTHNIVHDIAHPLQKSPRAHPTSSVCGC